MKVTRHMLWGNPRELHRLLNEPMRANKIPERDRQQWIKEQTDARIEALFAEHHIPAEWEESIQWEQLARALAGKLYPGCRTIERGRGGTRKTRRHMIEDEKRQLFEKFQTFRKERPSLSASRTAEYFMKEHKVDCDAVKLRTVRSFLKARRSMTKENQHSN
jgi:hypothetical protein